MQDFLISIKLAIKSLHLNWGRTLLSLIGIIIGVASVILVLSFGNGVKGFLVDQVSAFGSDIMEIEVKVPKTNKASSQNVGGMVGGTQITTFKLKDAQKIGKLPNVSAWYASVMGQQVVSYASKNKQTYIMGVTSGISKVDKKMEIASGTIFTEEDNNGLKQVAIIGSGIKDDFFGNQSPIGKKIKIKGQTYRVIGVLKKRGASGFFNFDDIIYLPLKTVQKKLTGVNYIKFAVFKLKDMSRLDITMLNATDIMRERHDITNPNDDDFSVNSIVEVTNILNKVFFTINLLLLALASISLIVGGVGIMNVMYIAVVERTFEIGLKKAVGAKNKDILMQFLLEAIFLTALGGIGGLAVGLIVSRIGEVLISNFGYTLKFTVTWWAALIGVGFSAIVGITFGYWPARKASQLSPMEALRKE